MSDKIKSWLFIVSTILIIGIVGVLAFKILLFLLPILLVIYIIFKIKGYIDRKSEKKRKINYTYEYKTSYNNESMENVDDSVGEVIDVDYEDVDK
ncbi:hypothetical protein [uncultured Clostridium sp.]|uniref:hypothetical protein n=1 Tax=uncultured Clostridium sp. TaxID=59620 RepID=UPI0025876CD0|nr:hypothetical protein [uncultured Clostridium sp.]